jgi:hypothetical protein
MKHGYIFFLLTFFFALSCKNIDDATPTNRNSFVRFYGTGLNHEGVMAINSSDGGYILIGNVNKGETSDITVIKADAIGNTVWEKIIADGTASSVFLGPDNNIYITGDRVIYNRNTTLLSEVINTQAHIFRLNENNGEVIGNEIILKDTLNVNSGDLTIDFKGYASTIINNELFVLGSYKYPEASLTQDTNERGFLMAFNLDDLNNPGAPDEIKAVWVQQYTSFQRDFRNINSLHKTADNNFIWANTFVREDEDGVNKIANIYVVPPNSINTDKDGLAESNRSFEAKDLQPGALGFGLIGTFSQLDGTGKNVFFARYLGSTTGAIDPASIRYFDGVNLMLTPNTRDESVSEDEGKAVVGTRDGGYVLACTFSSTINKGNGGKDILLIKINAFGDVVWTNLFGGSGDEIPASIRENEDGTLFVCGTINVNGLTSLILIKTDRNGNIDN